MIHFKFIQLIKIKGNENLKMINDYKIMENR